MSHVALMDLGSFSGFKNHHKDIKDHKSNTRQTALFSQWPVKLTIIALFKKQLEVNLFFVSMRCCADYEKREKKTSVTIKVIFLIKNSPL